MTRRHFFRKFFSTTVTIAMLSACGGGGSGGGGGTPSQQAMNMLVASYEAIVALAQYPAPQLCFSGQASSCNCPGGGTISVPDQTMLFSSCAVSNLMVFAGSLTVDGTSIYGTFSRFGECMNATVTGLATNACSGQITATCAGESVTEAVVDQSGGGCTIGDDTGG